VQENGWMNLGFPDRMVRTQKRLDPRYTIPKAYEVFVDFKKPPVEAADGTSFAQIPPEHWKPHTFRVFDVSSTGLGFLVPDELARQYPKGMLLKQLKLRVRGREISAEAEVMSCLPHKFGTHEPTQKVGIRFTRISQDEQDTLRAYVVENLIQYDTLTDD
jgi:c-di-GMP-binding flagellar brake protein YcgR